MIEDSLLKENIDLIFLENILDNSLKRKTKEEHKIMKEVYLDNKNSLVKKIKLLDFRNNILTLEEKEYIKRISM